MARSSFVSDDRPTESLSKSARWHRTAGLSAKRLRKDRIVKLAAKAAERGVEWLLSSDEYAASLGDGVCHWCKGGVWGNGVGLDRIDNGKGYEVDNVVPCCPTCNAERRTLTYVEYLAVWYVRRHKAKGGRSDRQQANYSALAAVGATETRQRMPSQFRPRQPEWRHVLKERMDKRSVGFDPDEPWPVLPERMDDESDKAYRLRCGYTVPQMAMLIGITKKCLRRKEAKKGTTRSNWKPRSRVGM